MKITQNKLIIKQKVEMLEIFSSFETKNRYSILDEKGHDQYYAFEESGFFLRQIWSQHRSLKINVIDNSKKTQLILERPFFFFRPKHTVKSGDGKVHGYINAKWAFFKKLYIVLDENSNEIFRIVAKAFSPWTFRIMKNGKEAAVVKKKWSGIGKEMFTDADTFLVDFGEIKSEKERTMMLASAFAIDLQYFEKDSHASTVEME